MATQRERDYANHVKKVKAIKNGSFILGALCKLGSPAHLNQIVLYIANHVKLPPQRIEFNVMCSIQEGVVAGFLTMSASQWVELQNFENAIQHKKNFHIFQAMEEIGVPSTAEQIIAFVAKERELRKDEVREGVIKVLEKAVTYGFLGVSLDHYYVDFHDLYETDPDLYKLLNENIPVKEPRMNPKVIDMQKLFKKDSKDQWRNRFQSLFKKRSEIEPSYTHSGLLLMINKILTDTK